MIDARTAMVRAVLVVSISCAGCSQPAPETPVVLSAARIPKAPTEEQLVKARAAREVVILYAQTGADTTEDNLIRTPSPNLDAKRKFYALGVFRGNVATESVVDIRVIDAEGDEVFTDRYRFVPRGETPVLFEVDPVEAELPPGAYRVFFDLDGNPCWELSLNLS